MLSFNDGTNNFPNCELLTDNTFLYNLINTQVSHMLADRSRGPTSEALASFHTLQSSL